MLIQLLTTYQQINMFILPLLGILWGMVYMRYRQESRFVPSPVRESFVLATNGRPAWKRMYQDIVYR